jgi:hypothetical protein
MPSEDRALGFDRVRPSEASFPVRIISLVSRYGGSVSETLELALRRPASRCRRSKEREYAEAEDDGFASVIGAFFDVLLRPGECFGIAPAAVDEDGGKAACLLLLLLALVSIDATFLSSTSEIAASRSLILLLSSVFIRCSNPNTKSCPPSAVDAAAIDDSGALGATLRRGGGVVDPTAKERTTRSLELSSPSSLHGLEDGVKTSRGDARRARLEEGGGGSLELLLLIMMIKSWLDLFLPRLSARMIAATIPPAVEKEFCCCGCAVKGEARSRWRHTSDKMTKKVTEAINVPVLWCTLWCRYVRPVHRPGE